MFRGISKHLPDRGRVLRVLAAWFVLAVVLIALPEQKQPEQHIQAEDSQTAMTESTQPANSTPQVASQSNTSSNQNSQPSPPKKKASSPQPTAANNTTSPTAPAPTEITVSLKLDSVVQGDVKLLSNGNQCDVLTRALEQNVIDSLDMRYSSQYKTHAVYVINGVGDSGSVWWTYKVNGKSPPLGCSNTKVHSGDSINWEYVKQ